jgi:hypothetical protein
MPIKLVPTTPAMPIPSRIKKSVETSTIVTVWRNGRT